MSEKRKGTERRKLLRTNAEAILKSLAPKPTAQTVAILMHELMVHKVELEMQNEELQRSNTSMEESRDRYANFYEFAPVGFITLSREGLIREINLTSCIMLGTERFRVIGRRLSSYVAPLDKDRWHRLLMRIMEHNETDKHGFDVDMQRADGSLFYAYLNCIKYQLADSSTQLHIAMTDISQLKQALNKSPAA